MEGRSGSGRFPLAVAVALLLVAGCAGSPFADPGTMTTQRRTIPTSATGVDLADSGGLVVEEGPTASLTITAGDTVMPHLTNEVKDGVVVLGVDGSRNIGRVTYRLVLPKLTSVRISGSGGATAPSATGDGLSVVIDGSGAVKVDSVKVATVKVDIGGSGGVDLTGTSGDQTVSIDGSGAYSGAHLATRRTTVTIGGSGGAHVNVAEKLTVRIDGSGSVTYAGDPNVTKDISGSGHVVQQ